MSCSLFNIKNRTTSQVMQLVSLALLPGILAEIYFFGWGVLINLILCSFYAVSSEAIILKIRKKRITATLKDYSALLTGLLIALAIPPILPWWMSLVGVSFAIIIGKQLYGGLGFNPFNPAMVGYVLLLISFPVEMTRWLPSSEVATQQANLIESLQFIFLSSNEINSQLQSYRILIDGFTMATLLDESKTAFSLGLLTPEIMSGNHFFANLHSGVIINLSFLLGGIFLLINRLIHWYIPVSILLSVFATATIIYMIDQQLFLPPWIHLISGATMLGAFFIATDPVSAATTVKGRLIYGAIIGFIIVIIRVFGGYPDAVAFAVLLVNIAVPTIDHYTKPKVYGQQDEVSQGER